MARKPRMIAEDTFYHVFDRGVEKRKIYLDDQDRLTFLAYLKDYSAKFEISIICYCLMENHYHIFLKTKQANLHLFMQKFHLEYVKYFNFKYLRVGSLFQGRYKSKLVSNEAYAWTLCGYIHQNPAELNPNIDCRTYRWSSLKYYLGLVEVSGGEWLSMGLIEHHYADLLLNN